MRNGLLAAFISTLALLAAPGAQAAPPASGQAVLLVSGFDTTTPFSTSDPSCASKAGSEWTDPAGPAAALRAAGYAVFTAPVQSKNNPASTPCTAGRPAPPQSTYIDSNGDLNVNGQALGQLIAFLRDNYGITSVVLVGHSDGGLWSRSAITQSSAYAGVTISSLTTLGTPHTGAFSADLIEELNGGNCDFSGVEQVVCNALVSIAKLAIGDLGPEATLQLTSNYLGTWNPEQTIGACPVSGVAGTFIDLPLPTFLVPAYYNANDGLVGEASALATASSTFSGTPIPAPGLPTFQSAGTFPVVHGASLSILSKSNLLNTAAVSQAVLSSVQNAAASAPACAAPPPTPPTPTPPTPPTPASPTDGSAAAQAEFTQLVPGDSGRLGRGERGDVIVSNSRARVTCGGKRLRSTALLGTGGKLKVSLPGRCKGVLRAGGSAAKVILVRHPGSYVSVEIDGNRLGVRVRRARSKRVIAEFAVGSGGFRKVRLSRRGAATIPSVHGPVRIRVSVTTADGDRLSAVATVSR